MCHRQILKIKKINRTRALTICVMLNRLLYATCGVVEKKKSGRIIFLRRAPEHWYFFFCYSQHMTCHVCSINLQCCLFHVKFDNASRIQSAPPICQYSRFVSMVWVSTILHFRWCNGFYLWYTNWALTHLLEMVNNPVMWNHFIQSSSGHVENIIDTEHVMVVVQF